MGKILAAIVIIGVIAVAAGAYFMFFYGDDSLTAEIDDDNEYLTVKGPKVNLKIAISDIESVDPSIGYAVGDKVNAVENAKIKSGEYKHGTLNIYIECGEYIWVYYDGGNYLVFNLKTADETKAFYSKLDALC
jgi:hypothetical protein